jgi:hypothetical protein
MGLRPVFWPWPPFFSSSSHATALPQRARFSYWANWWHPSALPTSHLFLGFPAGPLPPRLRSKFFFGILLSNILTTCPAHFNLLKTRVYVTRSVSLYSLYCSS